MFKQLWKTLRPLMKPLLVVVLVGVLVLNHADSALAARSGGRIGGGSFRAPSRTYTSPGGGYRSPGGYGGGFGFPFLIPFFGFGGGGGLFTLLIFLAIANFLVNAVRNRGDGEGAYSSPDPTVSVGKVQVGLMAEARYLQKELNELAETANTETASGRATILQEASLSLLRHPEYWVYGATESTKERLSAAEAKFNQISLAERSKFSSETLSNVNNQLRQASQSALSPETVDGELAPSDVSTGYLMVTLIVGVEGKLELPSINDSEDLRRALQQIGGYGSDRLLAIEVLWTPQAEGDTLSTEDILAQYPNIKLV